MASFSEPGLPAHIFLLLFLELCICLTIVVLVCRTPALHFGWFCQQRTQLLAAALYLWLTLGFLTFVLPSVFAVSIPVLGNS